MLDDHLITGKGRGTTKVKNFAQIHLDPLTTCIWTLGYIHMDKMHVDKWPHACGYMATRMWIHGYLHVDTWPHACGYMATCMWIHGHMHVDTWPHACGYMATCKWIHGDLHVEHSQAHVGTCPVNKDAH